MALVAGAGRGHGVQEHDGEGELGQGQGGQCQQRSDLSSRVTWRPCARMLTRTEAMATHQPQPPSG